MWWKVFVVVLVNKVFKMVYICWKVSFEKVLEDYRVFVLVFMIFVKEEVGMYVFKFIIKDIGLIVVVCVYIEEIIWVFCFVVRVRWMRIFCGCRKFWNRIVSCVIIMWGYFFFLGSYCLGVFCVRIDLFGFLIVLEYILLE